MAESNEKSSCSNPTKRARMDCLIHCSGDDSKLIMPQDFKSWTTLLNAAKIRNNAPVLEIAKDLPEGKVPEVYYHRKCRQIFTMKKDLDSIIAKQNNSTETKGDNTASSRQSSRCTPGPSRVYEARCIFCQKVTKYLTGQRTREQLTQCVELRADARIRDAAIKKMDDTILALISRDLVAAEGHYHMSCYRSYMYVSKGVATSSEKDGEDTEDSYDALVRQAFNELFQFIKKELFVHPEVVTMTDLLSRLLKYLQDLGITEVRDSTKKHMRRNLENEFGESLHIIASSKGKLLVFPDNLSIDDLVKTNHFLKTELNTWKSYKEADVTTKAALQLRADIKEVELNQVWPPDTDKNYIPDSLCQFMYTVLSGEVACTNPTERVKRLSNSFGQDMVYAVTHGKQKPSKHILLPFAVKSLTGNTELIHTLNRFGHSVSYSQLEEINTAICLHKLSLADSNVSLPLNIHPNVFTTLAWDNIDRQEETLSGSGTSHRVNGIAVQPMFIGPERPPSSDKVDKTKKRSISTEPTTLPIYNVGQRVGPPKTASIDLDTTAVVQRATVMNLSWILARMIDHDLEPQTVSSWTGYNILIHGDTEVIQDNIGYLPTINAPPTQMSTVYEVLNQSLNIMDTLQLNQIVCVFDQALYAKAAEIVWKHQEKFDKIILRLGVFHTICTLLSIIGKRFQDAGFKDICVEAGVIADGSMSGVMEGHRYNRAVRLHKLFYEALMRLAWKGFLTWFETNQRGEENSMEEALEDFRNLHDDISPSALKVVMESNACTRIMQLFGEYLDFLRHSNGKLSSFWMSYIDLVDIMLGLLRASREGDWLLHLNSIREMIPWCFAYDRLNYARYLPIYYAQMSRLHIDHPEVYEHFMNGGFSVQMGSNNPFGRIPVDQTIEETVNKDTQTSGGTKGFSLKHGAITKFYLIAEFRSIFLHQLRDMRGLGGSKLNHPDLQPTRIQKDEADIQALMDLMMENTWINPLRHDQDDFVNLATGVLATPEVVNDLLRAHRVGEEAYQTFKSMRLEKDPPDVKFHDTMKKQNLKTFAHIMKKKMTCKYQTKDVILKADRNLFGYMITVAQSRQLHMSDVLKHPLGPLPWAISNPDGSLRKTNKARLARQLENKAPPAETIPKQSACIIDGMGLIQKLSGNNFTFSQLAKSALTKVLHEGSQSCRIDVVFDVYWEESIKNSERCNRGSSSSLQFKSIRPSHKIKQWQKFLGNSNNKASLINFLVNEWKSTENREKLSNKTLYVTNKEACLKIGREGWEEVTDLTSSQEEADTRMLLHALHASNQGYKAVIIIAEDTDVFVLGLAFNKHIPSSLYLKCAAQNRTRYLDIGQLALVIGDDVCQALIGLHAFTGCDSVSAFAGRGKIGALKTMANNQSFQKTFGELGESWELKRELFDELQWFTCQMYAPSSTTSKVNKLRYELFCTKRGEVESSQLPPCEDSLFMHTLRANYQAAIWKRSLQSQPNVPDPKEHGWTTGDDGYLEIHWMRGSPAPMAVLELMSCKCARACKLPDCTCLAAGLKCMDMCKLKTCENQKPDEEECTVTLNYSDHESDEEYDGE